MFLAPAPDISVLRYVINIRQYAKFVVALGDNVASTDVEEGMRVGVDRQTYKIMLPLPAKIDPSVTMMQVRWCCCCKRAGPFKCLWRILLKFRISQLKRIIQVEEKPDVTYSDVGGCKDSIEKLREVVELPLLHPERFARLGIDPPKGILLLVTPHTSSSVQYFS
jgi:26S proteasome regulatory subunit T1